jgi:hypothetical protein
VAGGLAHLQHLVVGALDVGGCLQQEHLDADLLQRGGGRLVVTGQQDEVRVVGRDGLHVGLERAEVGHGGLGREARVVVDGDDGVAGTDGVEHLGAGRGHRDDPLRFGAGGLGGRAAGGCGAAVVVIAAGGDRQHEGQRQECGQELA